MALPRLPSIQEVWDDPTLIARLPAAIAEEYVARFRQIEQAVSDSVSIQPTPIEMAIAHPRYRWMDARHLHYLGDQVASAVDKHGAVIVTMPPRHAKSYTCSVWTPFWFLAQRPEEHVLLISSEAGFARGWGVKVRGLVELYGKEYGLGIDPKKTAGDDWALASGGGMKCVGAGGGIIGNPAKLLIFDDVIKNDEEARSELQREVMWDWWEGTVVQRIEPDTTTIGIGTRYHEDDLLGRILKHSRAGDGVPFEEITLRAKAEDDDPLGRGIGEGLWLEHFPQTFYDERERATSAYTWNSIYQQRPSPPGGNMVDPAWFRFYRPTELPGSFDQEIQTWDLALDAEKRADSYHAGLVMSRKGALIFLRDAYHEHSKIASSPNRMERTVVGAIRMWTMAYPGAKQKLIERALAGPMLIQTLHHEVPGLIPWPPKGQRKGSKEACLNACIPEIRSGNVLLPLNPDGTRPRWVDEFIEELRQFPNAPHDDYVDSFTQGMAFLLPGVRQSIAADHVAAKSIRPIVTPGDAHREALHRMLSRLAKHKNDALKKIQQGEGGGRLPFPPSRGLPSGLLPRTRRSNRGMW